MITPTGAGRAQGSAPSAWTLLTALAIGVAGSRVWRAAFVAAVFVLMTGSVLFSRAHHDAAPNAALALSVLGTGALVLLLRWPLPAIAIPVVANGAFVVASRLPWPPTAVIGWLTAIAVAPLCFAPRPAMTVLVFSEAAVVAGAVMPASVNARPWDAPISEALAVLLVWGAATMFRQRRESEAARAALDGELQALYERDVAARGRVAIARELHDVVAHHVSLIAVRAAMADYQVDGLSPAAKTAFDEIAAEARIALDELRGVLGVLRAPDGATPPPGPQPGLADLPDLVDRMRAGGLSVAVCTVGTPRPMTDATELCCYRVVQEALTNVMRHEPASTAHLDLDYSRDITITITNAVRVEPSGSSRPVAGFGLTGMRERVFAAGGEFHASVRDGLFRIQLRIPTDPSGNRP